MASTSDQTRLSRTGRGRLTFASRRSLLSLAVAIGTAVSGFSCSGATTTPLPTATPTPTAAPSGLPAFAHVYLMVLENEEYTSLVGASAAPYLNSLIAKYGIAANYLAVAHPSQPNYIALFSGSTQGVTSDGHYDLDGSNLADQLEAKGKTWAVFEQAYPGNCFAGATSSPKVDGPGESAAYARKHNPAISFTDIRTDATRCGRIMSFSQFDPAAADFELIVPNLCNDMHSCPVATGDKFLSEFVPQLTSSPGFANSVLFITTDEGTSNTGGGGRVATIVVSPLVHAGFSSATEHTHYSLLRTIEDAWGLGCLLESCKANNMEEFFK